MKKVSKRKLMELRFAVQHLSSINKETGFPVYDLGFAANMAMASALARIRPLVGEIDQHGERIRAQITELRQAKGNEAKIKVLEDGWQTMLDQEVELELSTIKLDQVQCKGQTPTPEILEMLSPIFG